MLPNLDVFLNSKVCIVVGWKYHIESAHYGPNTKLEIGANNETNKIVLLNISDLGIRCSNDVSV